MRTAPTGSSTCLDDELTKHDVECTRFRVVDHGVRFGASSNEGDGDRWPAIREANVAAEFLAIGTQVVGRQRTVATDPTGSGRGAAATGRSALGHRCTIMQRQRSASQSTPNDRRSRRVGPSSDRLRARHPRGQDRRHRGPAKIEFDANERLESSDRGPTTRWRLLRPSWLLGNGRTWRWCPRRSQTRLK